MKALLFAIFSFVLFVPSCTDLDEEVYDKVLVSEFGSTTAEISALVGPIYNTFRDIFPGSLWMMSEESGDMAITPTRKGGDWWDAGVHKELRLHTWTTSTNTVVGGYETAMANVALCNQIYYIINSSEAVSDKEAVLASIRGVRAFWYYILLDYWGNVPIVTDFTDKSNPVTSSRKDVYAFVLNELNDIKNIVRSDVTSESYGKITKGVVYTLLAKMYLNAGVWNPDGGSKWQECIDACDTVMSLGYILEPEWKANFTANNDRSGEIILPAVYQKSDGANYIHKRTLHYLDPVALGLSCTTWNGISGMPSYIQAYDPEDKRIEWSFLIGEMIDPETGDVLITAHNRPLNHTVTIEKKYNIDADGWGYVEQEEGARCIKWEIPKGTTNGIDADYGIFRLADVYLMKAECMVRLGINNDVATGLVNSIRERAFDDASKLKTSVTLDDIYQERRFELAWEGYSRQDMIRFGTFLNEVPGWKDYVSDSHLLLFPIPYSAISANGSLVQNPGY